MNLTAIVHAADGVRFMTTADCPRALIEQVVGYVLERCDYVLWPSVASEVRALTDDDKPYAAIATYFAHVGERWDEERLELGGLQLGRRIVRDELRSVCSETVVRHSGR